MAAKETSGNSLERRLQKSEDPENYFLRKKITEFGEKDREFRRKQTKIGGIVLPRKFALPDQVLDLLDTINISHTSSLDKIIELAKITEAPRRVLKAGVFDTGILTYNHITLYTPGENDIIGIDLDSTKIITPLSKNYLWDPILEGVTKFAFWSARARKYFQLKLDGASPEKFLADAPYFEGNPLFEGLEDRKGILHLPHSFPRPSEAVVSESMTGTVMSAARNLVTAPVSRKAMESLDYELYYNPDFEDSWSDVTNKLIEVYPKLLTYFARPLVNLYKWGKVQDKDETGKIKEHIRFKPVRNIPGENDLLNRLEEELQAYNFHIDLKPRRTRLEMEWPATTIEDAQERLKIIRGPLEVLDNYLRSIINYEKNTYEDQISVESKPEKVAI